MASKSKRRRKVLGASCILAALIIAASSFAWFTSKDEVTNRLTSTANYGVSIVESFAPPVNWIPGQDVNKDVFDVNTGSIDAFVRNDVSAKITYTYETLVNTFDSTNGVKLTNEKITDIDGATTMEAGAFLAWCSDNTVPLGTKISERATGADNNRWTPDKTGVYIFRRATDSTSTTGYTYAGYYFVAPTGTEPGKYYKIVIGDDYNNFPSAVSGSNNVFDVSSVSLGAGVTTDSDGKVISGTPSVKYVVETKVDNQDVTYTYDASNKKLVFAYTAAIAGSTEDIKGQPYDASALAARAEVDYENAKKFSEHSVKLYNNAKADLDYAKELAKQSNILIAAAKKASTDAGTTSTKKISKDADWDKIFDDTNGTLAKIKTDFDTTFGASFTAINPNTGNGFVPEAVINAANQTSGTDYVYPSVHTNYEELKTLYTNMSGYKTAISNAISALETIKSNSSTDKDADPVAVQAQVDIITTKMASFVADLDAYKTRYPTLVASIQTDTSITIGASESDAKKALINTAIANLGTANTDATQLNTDSVDYSITYGEWNSANATSTASSDAWNTAVTTYNTNVDAAKTTYESDIAANGVSQDHGTTLVPAYSVNDTGGDPKIAAPSVYTTYAAMYDKTIPTDTTLNVSLQYQVSEYNATTGEYSSTAVDKNETKKVSEWKSFMEGKQSAAATAKAAYDDAILRVNTNSTIKINVKLADDYADKWTYDSANTDSSKVATFYLNKILDAGQTSDKLIDSVELDSSVSAKDYKDLSFDLNVGLKSAQVTYDDSQMITTTAVVAPDFVMAATVSDQAAKTVTWAQRPATHTPPPTP